MKDKTIEILAQVFQTNVNTFKDLKARELIGKFITENLQDDQNLDGLSYGVFVKDTNKKPWLKKEHFVKIFYNEIEYVKEQCGLSPSEIHFLYDLGRFLKWELNLLVDEEDFPLNQKTLANKLNINVRTVQRNMDILKEFKLIYEIKYSREVFYIVNPYLMYCGKDINMSIPQLFDELGYYHSRTNRRDSVEKRVNIGI